MIASVMECESFVFVMEFGWHWHFCTVLNQLLTIIINENRMSPTSACSPGPGSLCGELILAAMGGSEFIIVWWDMRAWREDLVIGRQFVSVLTEGDWCQRRHVVVGALDASEWIIEAVRDTLDWSVRWINKQAKVIWGIWSWPMLNVEALDEVGRRNDLGSWHET